MTAALKRTIKDDIERPRADTADELVKHEWLVTNGLGGYASGTITGLATRRYHGLLVSALPAPLGRTMLLAHVAERIRLPDGEAVCFSGGVTTADVSPVQCAEYLEEFALEFGLPVWRYRCRGIRFEKRVFMPHGQNTVFVHYRLSAGGPVRLKLLPTVHFRPHDAPVSTPLPEPFSLVSCNDQYELTAADSPVSLRMSLHGKRCAFTFEPRRIPEQIFCIEESRGYEAKGTLWSPGYFRVDLAEDDPATLIASTEAWDSIHALHPDRAWEIEQQRREQLLAKADRLAREGLGAELVLAADQFVVKPASRMADNAVAHAAGDEARTVIAGYHWFTDWGRDTMISLEGVTLATGRHAEAGYLLRTFAHHVRDGLIPNLFPEGETEGLYHTADATLWFFHALDRYLSVTGDEQTLERLVPKLMEIMHWHRTGTRFGIGVDPADGLLRQGASGYQLTWMDAKVGDWVVTPRRGKAVEINALWYNAVRLMEQWLLQCGEARQAAEFATQAERIRDSFNRRFWFASGNYLYDVVDGESGDDSACRPNQVFAISLPHAVLDQRRWAPVLRVVQDRLLTPMGLRSLAPGHPDYKPVYHGDLRARDAAYHQGTVWGWLMGPFIDAWLKVHPGEESTARGFLEGFDAHLSDACLGTISEIFDAEAPYYARGCVAQAWSVAEVLRSWVKTRRP
jgi:predicted glycogen debranching enzyme